jgi:hypothetical protein
MTSSICNIHRGFNEHALLQVTSTYVWAHISAAIMLESASHLHRTRTLS